MTAGDTDAGRTVALDEYLARRAVQGFQVETRSGNQAVIVRRHRLHFVLHRFVPKHAEERLVVSVDQHGEVICRPAEPRRW